MGVDPTSNRESASFPPINATEIARAISNIYLVLEPWQSSEWANAEVAICNVGCFSDIVKAFQLQGRKFATAVDLSVKTSRDGIIIAVDSLTFLSAIEDNRNEGDVISYFRGLLEIARNSFNKASKCEQDFHEIRTGIIGVSNSVPRAMEAVKERSVRVEKDVRFRVSAAEHCSFGREAIKDVRKAEGFLSWASPVGQGLQIALPILQGVIHYAENANQKKIAERQQRLKALFDAIARLQTLDKDLFSIGCCLRTLVTWWSNTKVQLEQIMNNLEHYGVSFYRNDTIRNAVRNSWSHIKIEYSKYRDEVSKVQDSYFGDIKPLEEVDVGRKGALLTFQGDIQNFYEGLTYLKDITGTKADDQTKVQHALSSIEVGFISRLEIIDSSIEYLLRCIKIVDPIQRCTESGLVISKFFALLLTQDDDYDQSCARELDNVRHLVTSDYSGAKAFLSSMKMRFKNPTIKARAFQMISEMEKKNKEISDFCVNLFADGLWHLEDGLEECLLETRQKCTWFRDKLEHAAVREGFPMETKIRQTLHN